MTIGILEFDLGSIIGGIFFTRGNAQTLLNTFVGFHVPIFDKKPVTFCETIIWKFCKFRCRTENKNS